MNDGTVRFALIGYGLFGAHHARAIEAVEGASLAAIAARSDASLAAARRAHPGAIVSSDYRAVCEHARVDVVDVVVPNHLHFEVARTALAAGKHVLLEKPMATSLAHCDELIALAAAKERVLAIGHELRLSSLWGGVKCLIDRGAIGEPRHVLIELSRFPYRAGADGWRYDRARVGDWILEEPIHFFDLARWYLSRSGEPLSVYACGNSHAAERPELRDNFSAIVHFPGGAYAVVSQTLAAFGHHLSAKVTGSAGAIWAMWSAPDARSEAPVFSLRCGCGQDVKDIPVETPAGELVELEEEIRSVVRSVQHGLPPPCSGADGRWSVLLSLAAARSVTERCAAGIERLAGNGSAPLGTGNEIP